MIRSRSNLYFALFLVVLAGTSPGADAACFCATDQAAAMVMPGFGGPMLAQPMITGAVIAETLTPPGTIGETYTRPSHSIPTDKHPRTGMLAVRDNAAAPLLSVQTMGGFKMKSGIWLFESERPLDPGVCQIVRVEARKTHQDVEPFATKFVRLIPGRIVYLDF